MPLDPEKIQRRAVKAGVKASKKRDHLVSEDELLDLRIQVMPVPFRAVLILSGVVLIGLGWCGWPSDSNAIQGLEAIAGVAAILFGTFGIRRTLSHVLDTTSSLDLVGTVLELIADAVSNLDL